MPRPLQTTQPVTSISTPTIDSASRLFEYLNSCLREWDSQVMYSPYIVLSGPSMIGKSRPIKYTYILHNTFVI